MLSALFQVILDPKYLCTLNQSTHSALSQFIPDRFRGKFARPYNNTRVLSIHYIPVSRYLFAPGFPLPTALARGVVVFIYASGVLVVGGTWIVANNW